MEMNLIVEEAVAPYDSNPFSGKLYFARPTRNKPRDVPAHEWLSAIIDWVSSSANKWTIAIPVSFWQSINVPNAFEAIMGSGNSPFAHIQIMDSPGEFSNGLTPENSIREVVNALLSGKDVLLLSNRKKVSGFVPAILSTLVHPDGHIEKLLWPILHSEFGYELTPAQKGYLAGLYDSRKLAWLKLAGYGESENSVG